MLHHAAGFSYEVQAQKEAGRLADPPKVFISYSHDSPQHEERVLQLANRLRQHGVDAEIDQYEVSPAEGWPLWCQRQIVRADFVLMVCSETYLRRVEGEEEAGRGLGVLWEANFIRHTLYNSGSVSRKFVPILFSDGSDKNVPWMVGGFTRHQVDVDEGFSALWRQLRDEPAVKKPPVGTGRPGIGAAIHLPPKQPKPAAVEAAREQLEMEVQKPQSPLIMRKPEEARENDWEVPEPFRDVPGAKWCPEMIELPAGRTFLMGSSDAPFREEFPQHPVRIIRRFALGLYPVTFEEYDWFCSETNCSRMVYDDEGWGRGRRPVINVSWNEAQEYVEWLSKKTAQRYRLPTEAEWEYACRAGTTAKYSFGDRINTNVANFRATYRGTTEVGRFPANPWGLFDMHGNVWEWVEDAWHGYRGAPEDGSAWSGNGTHLPRVIRGGSWQYVADYLRSSARKMMSSDAHLKDTGFRVARAL